MKKTVATPLFLIAMAGAAHGQGFALVEVEAVVVKGQTLRSVDTAYSTTRLSNDDIRDAGVSQPDRLLARVPGMNVRDFGLGGVANSIVIRGFANGGHGGDLGVVLDGVPLNEAMSHADGYVDLNVIVPLEVRALTVYRGPVSTLYGNYNRGGLVSVETRNTGSYTELDASAAEFDAVDLQLAHGGALRENLRVNLAGQYARTDGFRPNSQAERATFAGRIGVFVGPRANLAFAARFHDAEADSASYLTPAQFDADPYGIDPNTQNDGSTKRFGSLRAELGYTLSPSIRVLAFAYGTRQDFSRYFSRPVSLVQWRQREETYEREAEGVGVSLNGRNQYANGAWNWAIGVEGFAESTDFMFFDGLDQRQRMSAAINDRTTALESRSAFGEVQAPLSDRLHVSLGARYDEFVGACRMNGSETGTDPCGVLSRAEHMSPKVGLRFQAFSGVELRASWSEGFALANGFIKYAMGGQPLDETVFRQSEFGASWRSDDRFRLDVAVFKLEATGEVRTVSPGVYENYGATDRWGAEISLDWRPTDAWRVQGNLAHTEAEITHNASASLVGKAVPGVSRLLGTLDVDWRFAPGWELSGVLRHVGSYAVDALNTIRSDAYDLIDLRLSRRFERGDRPLSVYLAVDNAADSVYATSVSVIGGQVVLASAPPRMVRVGVQANF